MIHYSEARNILNDKQPHKVVFVSKNKGTDTLMEKAVLTSSNFKNNTYNFRSIDSGQVRTASAVLLISIDNEEVYL